MCSMAIFAKIELVLRSSAADRIIEATALLLRCALAAANDKIRD
jgi:hypothetical protein